jgi:hypothetical protein
LLVVVVEQELEVQKKMLAALEVVALEHLLVHLVVVQVLKRQ